MNRIISIDTPRRREVTLLRRSKFSPQPPEEETRRRPHTTKTTTTDQRSQVGVRYPLHHFMIVLTLSHPSRHSGINQGSTDRPEGDTQNYPDLTTPRSPGPTLPFPTPDYRPTPRFESPSRESATLGIPSSVQIPPFQKLSRNPVLTLRVHPQPIHVIFGLPSSGPTPHPSPPSPSTPFVRPVERLPIDDRDLKERGRTPVVPTGAVSWTSQRKPSLPLPPTWTLLPYPSSNP